MSGDGRDPQTLAEETHPGDPVTLVFRGRYVGYDPEIGHHTVRGHFLNRDGSGHVEWEIKAHWSADLHATDALDAARVAAEAEADQWRRADSASCDVARGYWLRLCAAERENARLRAQVEAVRAYAKDREVYGRRGRTVHSSRIASDLLAIVADVSTADGTEGWCGHRQHDFLGCPAAPGPSDDATPAADTDEAGERA